MLPRQEVSFRDNIEVKLELILYSGGCSCSSEGEFFSQWPPDLRFPFFDENNLSPTDSDNKSNQNFQFTFHTVHQTNKFIYIARYAHNGNSKSLHNVWETLNKDTAQNISKQIKNSNDTNSPEPR